MKKAVIVAAVMFGCGAIGTEAQTIQPHNGGIRVGTSWHTIANPAYGAAFQYDWNDIEVRDCNGIEVPMALNLAASEGEMGAFNLTSAPISVPGSGMVITFTRTMEMRPFDAERGTTLPSDPEDRCRYAADGAMRAIFHQVLDVVDAATGEVLIPEIDRYRLGITRRDVLKSTVKSDVVTVDLASCADRKVILKARVLTAYNGRGPATGSLTTTTRHNVSSPQNSSGIEDLK